MSLIEILHSFWCIIIIISLNFIRLDEIFNFIRLNEINSLCIHKKPIMISPSLFASKKKLVALIYEMHI